MKNIIKTYSELITIPTFQERFKYLKLNGAVGTETFGYYRWLNQQLYHSTEWRRFRDRIIIRDNGCDLGIDGYELDHGILIHHINPITKEDILERTPCVFDPDNAICVSHNTHQAIHYGDEHLLMANHTISRSQNDMAPWKSQKIQFL